METKGINMARFEKDKRLQALVAELKKNSYPNSTKMLKIFNRSDENNDAALNITPRTFSRDIKFLKEQHDAPIEFDHTLNGYYLTKPSWSLDTIIYEGCSLEAEVLANKIAQDISPSSLASEFDDAIVGRLCKAGTLFPEQSVSNFFSADTVVVHIDKEVMSTIYNGWKGTQAVTIVYKRPDGSTCERLFEPHVVTCSNRIWYVKGYCHLRKENRIFALHRILEVKLTEFYFTVDQALGKDNKRETFFDYPTVKGARLWCSPNLASYVKEQASAREITLEEAKGGALIMILPEVNESDLVRWILGEAKSIKVLAPKSLQDRVRRELQEALASYQ